MVENLIIYFFYIMKVFKAKHFYGILELNLNLKKLYIGVIIIPNLGGDYFA